MIKTITITALQPSCCRDFRCTEENKNQVRHGMRELHELMRKDNDLFCTVKFERYGLENVG